MAYPTAVSLDIAAPTEKVWGMVSDLPRMGEWSPENQGGQWANGVSGPAVGAVFTGKNKNGVRRWSTKVTVVECDPGRVFEISVTYGPLGFPIANWRYDFEETPSGCRVTESWLDHRKPWMVTVSRVMGDHSATHAAGEMEATLAKLAAAAQ